MRKGTNIYLIGMMGCGKSTVGRLLAERLKLEFIDLDTKIEKKAGKSITDIFTASGEERFRALETEALARVAGRRKYVVSTGGGCVLRRQNRSIMQNDGTVIYLDVPLDILVERVSRKKHRPLLTGVDDIDQRMRELLNQRESMYRKTATFTVKSNGLQAEAVVENITGLIN